MAGQFILLITDRSVVTNKGCFDWVISAQDGIILAEGKGQTYGTPINPLHVEAFGLIAGLCLLVASKKFLNLSCNMSLHATDNTVHLKKLNKFADNQHTYTQQQWDVLEIAFLSKQILASVILQTHP